MFLCGTEACRGGRRRKLLNLAPNLNVYALDGGMGTAPKTGSKEPDQARKGMAWMARLAILDRRSDVPRHELSFLLDRLAFCCGCRRARRLVRLCNVAIGYCLTIFPIDSMPGAVKDFMSSAMVAIWVSSEGLPLSIF